MYRKVFAVLVLLAAFAGCGNQVKTKDVYYVQSGVANFYNMKSDKMAWDSSVYWGYKYFPVSVSNNIVTIDGEDYVNVMSALNKDKKGYIKAQDLILNPVSPGVILNKVLVRAEPSFRAGKKAFVTPPTLLFIIKTNSNAEGLWAEVKPYRPTENYFNTPDYKQMDYLKSYFVELKHISTKRDDIELISGTMVAVRTFNSSTKDAKDKISLSETEINELINRYPESPAILYAKQALEYINPSAYSSTNSAYGDGGNPLLDEDLSGDGGTDSDSTVINSDEI